MICLITYSEELIIVFFRKFAFPYSELSYPTKISPIWYSSLSLNNESLITLLKASIRRLVKANSLIKVGSWVSITFLNRGIYSDINFLQLS